MNSLHVSGSTTRSVEVGDVNVLYKYWDIPLGRLRVPNLVHLHDFGRTIQDVLF